MHIRAGACFLNSLFLFPVQDKKSAALQDEGSEGP